MATELIPVRFYGLDTVIYLISAAIGLMIAYKAYRLYDYSGKKQHLYLALAFTLLGIALATLTLTTSFTYYSMLFTESGIYFFDPLFNVDDLGFWIYYIASFVAYLLLAFIYFPQRRAAFVPAIFFSARYFEYFNIVLFFIIAFVAFRAVTNYLATRSKPAFLVALAFVMIAAYHAILPFAAFSKVAYVIAHGAHIAGFGSLLIMLLSTGKK